MLVLGFVCFVLANGARDEEGSGAMIYNYIESIDRIASNGSNVVTDSVDD